MRVSYQEVSVIVRYHSTRSLSSKYIPTFDFTSSSKEETRSQSRLLALLLRVADKPSFAFLLPFGSKSTGQVGLEARSQNFAGLSLISLLFLLSP